MLPDLERIFDAEARFITREVNQWYREPASTNACSEPPAFSETVG